MQNNSKIKVWSVITISVLIISVLLITVEAKWSGINKVFFNKIQLLREGYVQKRGFSPDYDVKFVGNHAIFSLSLSQKGILLDTLKVKIEGVDLIITGEYFYENVVDETKPSQPPPGAERFRNEQDKLEEEELATVYPNETPAQLRKRIQERKPGQGYSHTRASGSFSNTFPVLPQGVKPEQVRAIYYPGTLEVTIGSGVLWELHKLTLWPKGVRQVKLEF